jgi:hypothetical protein
MGQIVRSENMGAAIIHLLIDMYAEQQATRNFIISSLLEQGASQSAKELKSDIEKSKNEIVRDLKTMYGDLDELDNLLSSDSNSS